MYIITVIDIKMFFNENKRICIFNGGGKLLGYIGNGKKAEKENAKKIIFKWILVVFKIKH